jgi:hypothetical protein
MRGAGWDNPWSMKVVIAIALIAVLTALGERRAVHAAQVRRTAATTRSATPAWPGPWRCAWRCRFALFLFILLAWKLGWITPSGIPTGR